MKASSGSAMLAATVLALASVGPVHAKAQQASARQVRELLQVTGSAGMMHSMMEQMNSRMSSFMQRALPCVPATYWKGFADDKAEQDLINRMVPIYQNHFTRQDVAGLLKFYRTPLGQKVIHEMPKTMSEAMQVGQNWGRNRAQKMIEKLQKDGTLNDQGKCPATGADSSKGAAAPGKAGGK